MHAQISLSFIVINIYNINFLQCNSKSLFLFLLFQTPWLVLHSMSFRSVCCVSVWHHRLTSLWFIFHVYLSKTSQCILRITVLRDCWITLCSSCRSQLQQGVNLSSSKPWETPALISSLLDSASSELSVWDPSTRYLCICCLSLLSTAFHISFDNIVSSSTVWNALRMSMNEASVNSLRPVFLLNLFVKYTQKPKAVEQFVANQN